MSSDATHLSAGDEQRLTEAAGIIHAAMHDAHVATARPWPIGEVPR